MRSRLRDVGAKQLNAYDEENVRYRPFRKQPITLRLRLFDGGPSAVLTAKGPARYERRIKIREEVEVALADGAAMQEVFGLLGFKVAVVYHKRRETWQLRGCHVTLDTLDFGFFSEIEGPIDALEGVAELLGLAAHRPVKSSYSELARAHARRGG